MELRSVVMGEDRLPVRVERLFEEWETLDDGEKEAARRLTGETLAVWRRGRGGAAAAGFRSWSESGLRGVPCSEALV